MSVADYFHRAFELLPPGEPLVLSRERWDWILATHGADDCSAPTAADPGTRPRPAVYGAAELADEFGLPESSMRALLSRGLCGNPPHLKRSGPRKAYRVPTHIVSAIHEEIASGHALGTFCIVNLTPPWPDRGPYEAPANRTSTREPDVTIDLQPAQQTRPTPAHAGVPRKLRTAEITVEGGTTSPANGHQKGARPARGGSTDLGAWRKIAAERSPVTRT